MAEDTLASVRIALGQLERAWAAGDAQTYAGAFHPACIVVTPRGAELQTREQVERFYAAAFEGAYGGSLLSMHISTTSRTGEEELAFSSTSPTISYPKIIVGVVCDVVRPRGEHESWRQTIVLSRPAASTTGSSSAGGWLVERMHSTTVRDCPGDGRRRVAPGTWRALGKAAVCVAVVAAYAASERDFRRFSRGALAALLCGTAYLVWSAQ
jgi:uncharacterized protein (TIGR02246 family)